MSAEELWRASWPAVPFEEASDKDRKLFIDHAESIALYEESHEEIPS